MQVLTLHLGTSRHTRSPATLCSLRHERTPLILQLYTMFAIILFTNHYSDPSPMTSPSKLSICAIATIPESLIRLWLTLMPSTHLHSTRLLSTSSPRVLPTRPLLCGI